jgi:hypothetical protein
MADVDPVALGRLHDADIAATIAALNGPNPHSPSGDLNLPAALADDGGRPS